MRGNGRYQVVLGLALAASLAFLAFLLARPAGDDVLREADVAMYTAKARGKGRFELASTSI